MPQNEQRYCTLGCFGPAITLTPGPTHGHLFDVNDLVHYLHPALRGRAMNATEGNDTTEKPESDHAVYSLATSTGVTAQTGSVNLDVGRVVSLRLRVVCLASVGVVALMGDIVSNGILTCSGWSLASRRRFPRCLAQRGHECYGGERYYRGPDSDHADYARVRAAGTHSKGWSDPDSSSGGSSPALTHRYPADDRCPEDKRVSLP